jgi:serine/threonine protein kinase
MSLLKLGSLRLDEEQKTPQNFRFYYDTIKQINTKIGKMDGSEKVLTEINGILKKLTKNSIIGHHVLSSESHNNERGRQIGIGCWSKSHYYVINENGKDIGYKMYSVISDQYDDQYESCKHKIAMEIAIQKYAHFVINKYNNSSLPTDSTKSDDVIVDEGSDATATDDIQISGPEIEIYIPEIYDYGRCSSEAPLNESGDYCIYIKMEHIEDDKIVKPKKESPVSVFDIHDETEEMKKEEMKKEEKKEYMTKHKDTITQVTKHLHDKTGINHSDIKSANLFLDISPEKHKITLIDFGEATINEKFNVNIKKDASFNHNWGLGGRRKTRKRNSKKRKTRKRKTKKRKTRKEIRKCKGK